METPTYADPAMRARVATVALAAYMLAEVAKLMVMSIMSAGMPVDLAALAVFATMIAAVIATAVWIYRINANAHSFAEGLSITPGWNVGWFFVPIASLWKPFEGIKESWQASEDAANWPVVPVPSLLRAWWGVWLSGNILGSVSLQLSRAAGDVPLATALDVASSVLLIAAGGLLIRIIATMSPLQRRAHDAQIFA